MTYKVTNQLLVLQKQGRLGHAYIIEGVSEICALDIMRDITQSLQVAQQDLHHISPIESVSIKVDQIRSLQDRLSRKPVSIMHLVCLTPADKMNQSASNSLLKLLEEPPGNACFLLFTVNRRKLMPTIRSRAQVLRCLSQALEYWSSHEFYREICTIYGMNPGLLREDAESPLGLRLYHEVVLSSSPLEAIHAMGDIDTSELIMVSILLFACLMRSKPSIELWVVYDELVELSRLYQISQNLNKSGVLDRIGIAMTVVQGIQLKA
jgi:hypothetical protein